MLGPGIRTPLLDRMSVQLQFTLGNAGVALCVDYHLGEQEDFILYHCFFVCGANIYSLIMLEVSILN